MTACLHSNSSAQPSTLCGWLASVLTTVLLSIALLSAGAAFSSSFVQRGRVSPADLADIDPRIVGPDVLGERMVVPPNIPDWVFMDCQSDNSADENPSLINRVRQSICRRS
jgi:hypothetical protein